jgi:hypothetical protein
MELMTIFLFLVVMGIVELTLVSKLTLMVGGFGKLPLAFASTVIFGFGLHGTGNHISQSHHTACNMGLRG